MVVAAIPQDCPASRIASVLVKQCAPILSPKHDKNEARYDNEDEGGCTVYRGNRRGELERMGTNLF